MIFVQADFEAILADKEDAKFAYELFDLDGDGFVLETEVHERFEEIYRCVAMVSCSVVDLFRGDKPLSCDFPSPWHL